MAAAKYLIFVVCALRSTVCHELATTYYNSKGICGTIKIKYTIDESILDKYKECVVVIGHVQVAVLEEGSPANFTRVVLPKLREVTDYVVVHRVSGVESLAQLFPNLSRIRGLALINNFALIVYDVANLAEIGLYNLMKIDRGGVIIWGGPHTCYIETVDWTAVAPTSRRVLNLPDRYTHCDSLCSCTTSAQSNRCWNNKKCQRFVSGPDAEQCNEQCLGCRNTVADECFLCRHYTHRNTCLSECPNDTLVIKENQYCVTEEECKSLHGWRHLNTCVFSCPIDYILQKKHSIRTCKSCPNCNVVNIYALHYDKTYHRQTKAITNLQTCESLNIQSLEAIQAMEKCIYINGSLIIHLRAIPNVMEELRYYFRRLVYVSDFIAIYGSLTITSLDFLSSLQHIGGKKLKDGKNSFNIYQMQTLQTLLAKNVTEHLKIERGSLSARDNPVLCPYRIDELKKIFPNRSDEIDIPHAMNGYSGGCTEIMLDIQIEIVNDTSVVVTFVPKNSNVQYSILYVRLPPGENNTVVPESCSEYEWFAVNLPVTNNGTIGLNFLHPASNYILCIETYDPVFRSLSRTPTITFTTPVGKPKPPFILELVAASSEVVVLRWVDHKDFRSHITRYQLDVSIVEYLDTNTNYCDENSVYYNEIDYSRHAVVMRPPPDYNRGCESLCGVLASATAGAMVEEHFEACVLDECESHEPDSPGNSTIGKFVKTMSLNFSGPRNNFQVGNLSPFRDYRFRLRACTSDICSRSFRGIVRTLSLNDADVPDFISAVINTNYEITTVWNSPNISNGFILSYLVRVLPGVGEMNEIVPQVWCALSIERNLTVQLAKADKYWVQICSKTLVSTSACTDWHTVISETPLPDRQPWMVASVLCGIVLCFASCLFGHWLHKSKEDDSIPLVDLSSMRNESEPPSLFYSDFIPSYSIPLRDTKL